jgi:capsular polysaccharide biosynthesis protein
VELRQYLAILWRRWPVIALIVGLALIYSVVTFLTTPPTYTAAVRLLVRQLPSPDTTPPYFNYDRYYNWLANEFVSDDYTLIVTSRAFAERVAQALQQNPKNADGTLRYGFDTSGITADAVIGTLSADRKHRIMTITARSGNRGNADAIANAAADVLTNQTLNKGTAPSLSAVQIQDDAEFGLLDRSSANLVGSSRARSLIDAGVRLGLGIVAALALAFLIEYFDDRLRDGAEAERLTGVPVLGSIPRT